MDVWQEEQLHALQTVQCEHQLFSLLVLLARPLNFDYCAYGLRMPLPLTHPKTALFNNYPATWQRRYQEQRYIAVDPTVQHGMRSLSSVLWSDDLFAPQRAFWEEARSFGLAVGWAQACRNVNGVRGMLTLARSGEALSAAELQDKGFKMAWLAQAAHLGMSRLLAPKLLPEAGVQLSDREIEVLRWTGDGKTSGEIADILHIAERTVNFHINNAMVKLHVANKTAAVIWAAMLGLL